MGKNRAVQARPSKITKIVALCAPLAFLSYPDRKSVKHSHIQHKNAHTTQIFTSMRPYCQSCEKCYTFFFVSVGSCGGGILSAVSAKYHKRHSFIVPPIWKTWIKKLYALSRPSTPFSLCYFSKLSRAKRKISFHVIKSYGTRNVHWKISENLGIELTFHRNCEK